MVGAANPQQSIVTWEPGKAAIFLWKHLTTMILLMSSGDFSFAVYPLLLVLSCLVRSSFCDYQTVIYPMKLVIRHISCSCRFWRVYFWALNCFHFEDFRRSLSSWRRQHCLPEGLEHHRARNRLKLGLHHWGRGCTTGDAPSLVATNRWTHP